MARARTDAGAQVQIIVLCRGVFDLLHVAHVRHLQEARSMGDFLVVSLTTDKVAEKEKRKPVIPQAERKEMLLALSCVSEVDLCGDYLESLRKWEPTIYCKGYDHNEKGFLPGEVEFCASHGINIVCTGKNPQTTSAIIERIRCTY